METLSRGVAIFLGIMELCSGSLTKLEKDALDRGSIGVAIGGLFLLDFLAVEDGAFADEGTVFDGDNIESIGESSVFDTFFLWVALFPWFPLSPLLLWSTLLLPLFLGLAVLLGVFLGVFLSLDGAMVEVYSGSSSQSPIDI